MEFLSGLFRTKSTKIFPDLLILKNLPMIKMDILFLNNVQNILGLSSISQTQLEKPLALFGQIDMDLEIFSSNIGSKSPPLSKIVIMLSHIKL